MSVHLLIAAAYLEDLPPSRKLVLMAIADSADEHTLEAAPGLPKLRAWSDLSKSAALAAVKALTEAGLIARVEAGRLGRRATYRVFPAGVPSIPAPADVKARYEDSQPVENSPETCGEPESGGSCPQDPRVLNEPPRVLPTGPLQSSTSVSTRDAQPEPPARPVERATGFPGTRATADDDRDRRRRARGANDTPCPMHPDQIIPCGRCANLAAKDRERNPEGTATAVATARALIAAARHPDPKE